MTRAVPLFLLLLSLSSSAGAGPTPARSRASVTAFRKTHPCPATGKTTGACPGWVIDHAVPLCWGGPDDPSNLIWQERAQSFKKDAFERAACALKQKAAR